MEVVNNLLLRAGWEPPSLAFPLVRQALKQRPGPWSTVGTQSLLSRFSASARATKGLYQPIFRVALARLTEFLGPDGGKGYLWGPAYAALVDLSSPSFRVVDQPVAVNVATSCDRSPPRGRGSSVFAAGDEVAPEVFRRECLLLGCAGAAAVRMAGAAGHP